MEPFRSMGMTTLTVRNTGGTDHLSYDAVGLPGWQFIQDPIEYDTLTHHTNLDSYERLQPNDMMKNATIAAAFAYLAANRDDKMPRKPMPVPTPAGRGAVKRAIEVLTTAQSPQRSQSWCAPRPASSARRHHMNKWTRSGRLRGGDVLSCLPHGDADALL